MIDTSSTNSKEKLDTTLKSLYKGYSIKILELSKTSAEPTSDHSQSSIQNDSSTTIQEDSTLDLQDNSAPTIQDKLQNTVNLLLEEYFNSVKTLLNGESLQKESNNSNIEQFLIRLSSNPNSVKTDSILKLSDTSSIIEFYPQIKEATTTSLKPITTSSSEISEFEEQTRKQVQPLVASHSKDISLGIIRDLTSERIRNTEDIRTIDNNTMNILRINAETTDNLLNSRQQAEKTLDFQNAANLSSILSRQTHTLIDSIRSGLKASNSYSEDYQYCLHVIEKSANLFGGVISYLCLESLEKATDQAYANSKKILANRNSEIISVIDPEPTFNESRPYTEDMFSLANENHTVSNSQREYDIRFATYLREHGAWKKRQNAYEKEGFEEPEKKSETTLSLPPIIE